MGFGDDWAVGKPPPLEPEILPEERLRAAVRAIYYGSAWRSDRLTDEQEQALWTELRDAADFEPGHSPESRFPDRDSAEIEYREPTIVEKRQRRRRSDAGQPRKKKESAIPTEYR